MGNLHVFLFVLSFCTVVNGGSGQHSLYALATYMTGETPFPGFTVVVMLDDVQVGYYDSNIDKVVHFGHDKDRKSDMTPEGVHIFRLMQFAMEGRMTVIKHHYNLTKGIQVLQRITGCEIMPSGEAALMMFQDVCNTIDADGFFYNMTKSTYLTGTPWKAVQWDEFWLPIHTMRYTHFYLPYCMKELKNLLEKQRSVVLRRVRPRVRFIEKPVPGGVQVSCLATDFYPRHINLTLLRDGQPVAEQELTGGAVLPNGNGLYQVRKTLEIKTQELREIYNYTCTASHLSLDNKLDISWKPDFSREHRVHILSGSGAMVAMVLILLSIFMCVRKMRKVTDSRATLQQLDNIDAQ